MLQHVFYSHSVRTVRQKLEDACSQQLLHGLYALFSLQCLVYKVVFTQVLRHLISNYYTK